MNGLLFIDDEEGVRRSVIRALKKEPYQLYTSENGEEGIEFVKNNPALVTTVISDYRMQGLNGLITERRTPSSSSIKSSPFIQPPQRSQYQGQPVLSC